jgi:hypothetical protein
MPSRPSRVSAPFADRELDGTVLLEELANLRNAGVPQRALELCNQALESLSGLSASDAADQLRAVAFSDFPEIPALAQLLVRWATKLKRDEDVLALQGHFRKLALTSALLHGLWQAAVHLNPRRRG